MTDEEENIVVTGGVVVAAYLLVVKPLLADFGLSTDQQAAVNSILSLTPQQNPFSPLFQPLIDYEPPGFDPQAWAASAKQSYDNLSSADQLVVNWSNAQDVEIAKAAEIVYNSRGFTNNFDSVLQVFAAVPDKKGVAAMALYLLYNYNVDLWHFLRNGKWYNISGMNGVDITTIVNRVMSLPNIF